MGHGDKWDCETWDCEVLAPLSAWMGGGKRFLNWFYKMLIINLILLVRFIMP